MGVTGYRDIQRRDSDCHYCKHNLSGHRFKCFNNVYVYRCLSAFDAAGNESTQSSPASATTLDFGSTINTIAVGDMDGNGQDDLTVNFGSDSVIWM